MKKRLLVWLLAALLPLLPLSAAQVSVNVQTAGTLWETLDDMGVSADTVSNLKVSGLLNATDYQVFRKIMKNLRELDLTGVLMTSFPTDGCFENMTTLTTVKLPATITSFNSSTFRLCTNLVRLSFGNDVPVDSVVVFPASLTDIGYSTFEYCYGFKSIDLSRSTTFNWIHSSAFRSTNIETAIMPSDGYSLEDACFYDSPIKTWEVDQYCEYIGGSMWNTLRAIYARSSSPIGVAQSIFNEIDKDSCILYVPIGSRRSYMLADGWDQMTQIREYGIQVKISDHGAVLYNNMPLDNNQIIFHNEQQAVFTVRPDAGYEMASVTVDNQPVAVVDNQITIPAGVMGATIRVSFQQKTLTLNASVVGNGSVTLNGASIASGYSSTFPGGTVLTFRLTPEIGYDVQSITCNGTALPLVDGGYVCVIDGIDENSEMVFTFANSAAIGTTHTLAYAQIGKGDVRIAGSLLASESTLRVEHGASVVLDIAPYGDFTLEQVTYNGTDITSSVSGNQLTVQNITSDADLTVRFSSPTDLILTLTGGDLYSQLQALGADMGQITSLTLSGSMIASDFAVIKSVIPSLAYLDISGCTGVTSFPGGQFYGNSAIKRVVLPSSVTSIEENAFRECPNLVSVTGCEGVRYIHSRAFYQDRQLTTLPWGNNLERIYADGAFEDCTSLPDEIVFSASFIECSNYSFKGCTSIKSVNLSACSNFGYMGYESFCNCSALSTILFPNTNFRIEHYALQNTIVASIDLPSRIGSIGTSAFPSSLTSINCQSATPCSVESNTFDNVNTTSGVLNVPVGASYQYRIATGWSNFRTINEAGLIFEIGENGKVMNGSVEVADGTIIFHDALETAFTLVPSFGYEATSAKLGDIDLQVVDNVITIPAGTVSGTVSVAFARKTIYVAATINGQGSVVCNGQTLASPASISVVGGESLSFALTPDSGYVVKSIVFNGEPVVLANGGRSFTTPAIGDDATVAFEFALLSSLTNTAVVTVEQDGEGAVTYMGAELASGSDLRVEKGTSLTLVFSPSGDYSIAKVECNGVEVTDQLRNGRYTLTDIQADAVVRVVYESPNVLTLELAGGDLYNKISALGANLNTIKSLTLSGQISTSDFNVMKNLLPALKYVDLSGCEGLTVIPADAFREKNSLEYVKLPTSVTRIESAAFYYCRNLKQIDGCDNVEYIDGSFHECNSLKNLPFGDKLKECVNAYAFANCWSLPTTIVLPASVERLGSHTFIGCSNLKKIDLSACDNLTSLVYAFADMCTSLQEVVLPTSASFAFESYCLRGTAIREITIPAGVTFIYTDVFPAALRTLNIESPTLIPANGDAFNSVDFTACQLNVPFGTSLDYRMNAPWSSFLSINEKGLLIKYDEDLGSISFAGSTIADGAAIFHNAEEIVFSLQPSTGYYASKAMLGTTELPILDNVVTVPAGTIAAELAITFSQKQLNAAVSTIGNGHIIYNNRSLPASANLAAAGGDALNFAMVADSGYVLNVIRFNGEEITLTNTASYTTPALDADATVEFEFVALSTLGNTAVVEFSQQGQGNVLYLGSIVGQGSTIRVEKGTDVVLSISNIGDYSLQRFEVNGTDLTDSIADGQYTIRNLQADAQVSVKFFSPTILSLELTGGDLYTQLQNLGVTMSLIKGLSLKGNVAASDFSIIKNVLSGLETLDLRNTSITQLPENACSDLKHLTTVALPLSVTEIKSQAFRGCNELLTITGCDNITTIESEAFADCHELKVLPWENKLVQIHNEAMRNCWSLPSSIKFPVTLRSLYRAFSGCSSLQSVDFSDCSSLQALSYICFENCTGLTSVILPREATSYRLEHATFSGTSIEEITLTKGLASMSGYEFPATLKTINVENPTPPSAESNTFINVDKTTCKLNVPAGSLLNYRTTAPWAAFVNIEEAGLKMEYNSEVGSVSVAGKKIDNGGIIFHNAEAVTIDIAPVVGYSVASVKLDNNPLAVADNKVAIPAGTVSGIITVSFVQKALIARTSILGSGTVRYADRTLAVADSVAVAGGESLDFVLVPDSGYAVKAITFNGEEAMLMNGGLNYKTQAMDQDAQIVFEFAPLADLQNTAILSVSIIGDGAVLYQGASLTDGGQVRFNKGSDFVLSFLPEGDFAIDSIALNGTDITYSLNQGMYAMSDVQTDVQVDVRFASPTKLILDLRGGDLYSKLMELGVDVHAVSSLTVSGSLSLSDFSVIHSVLTGLETVDLSQTDVATIPNDAFREKQNLREVKLPLSVTRIGNSAFYYSQNLESVTGCDNVQTIEPHAFNDCQRLRTLPFGNHIAELQDYALSYCNSLPATIVFPASFKGGYSGQFYHCQSIRKVDMSKCSSLDNVGWYAFENCQNLEEVILPTDHAYGILNNAFLCTNIRQIAIPACVNDLRGNAFSTSLQVLNVEVADPANFTYFEQSAFANVDKVTCVLNVPAGSSLLYRTTAPWMEFQTITESGIKVNYNEHGSVFADDRKKAPGSVVFHNMENVAFRAEPAPGYEVGSVRFNRQEVAPNAEGLYVVGEGVESDTLAVNFVLRKFAVNVQTTGAGHVQFADSALAASSTLLIDSSTVAVMTLVPDSGYMVKRVSFNGEDALVQNAGSTYATPAICAPASVSVEFAAASELTDMALITFTTGENGTTEYKNSTLLSPTSFYVQKGTDALFTFKPAEGYTVDSLIVNDMLMNDSVIDNQLHLSNLDTTDIHVSFCLNPNMTLHLEEAGQLSRRLTAEQKQIITALTISGELNNEDFITLRDELPKLEVLDIYATDLRSIPSYAFCSNSGTWDQEIGSKTLKSVRLPQYTESIDYCAFAGCKNLTTVNFEELTMLQGIGERAFATSGILKADLSGTRLTDLTNYQFRYAKELTKLRLPATLRSLGGSFEGTAVDTVDLSICRNLTDLGGATFYVCKNLSSVTLPAGLKRISDHALRECPLLTQVEFPASLEYIGSYAFEKSGLKNVDLSATRVQMVYDNAFSECQQLTSVALPTTILSIGHAAFHRCSTLEEVNFADLTNLSTLGNNVFVGTKIQEADLSTADITRVGDYLFNDCKDLTTVILPQTVTEIGAYAFSECTHLDSINMNTLSALTKIEPYAFYRTPIRQLDLSNTAVTTIEDCAFHLCNELTAIRFPNTLRSIGSHAFRGATKVASLQLPESLMQIADGAFADLPLHGKLTLPSNLTQIGWEAFGGDYSMIYSNAVVPPTIQSNSFSSQVAVVFVPESSAAAYKEAPVWMDYNILTREIHAEVTVTQPGRMAVDIMEQDSVAPGLVTHLKVHGAINSTDFAVMRSNMTVLYDLDLSDADVSIIPSRAFADKTVLMHVKLPENLLMIESEAFVGCSSLCDTLVLPSRLKTVGVSAFANCSSISYLVLDSALEVIRNYAFYSCSGLDQELTFPAELTSLGEFAFANCSKLHGTVTFNPEFYMFIGAEGYHSQTGYTFQNCRDITGVDMHACEYVYEIPTGVFEGCSSLRNVLLPPYVERIDEYAFQNCQSLTDIKFPTSLLLINNSTFSGCSSFRNLELSQCTQLGSIMDYAFYGCSSLRTVRLPKSINYLGGYCFAECRNLENINVEAREPADLGDYVFRRVNTENCVLSIPTLSFNDYLIAAQWGAFVQMRKAISITLDEGAELSYSRGAESDGPNGVRARTAVQGDAEDATDAMEDNVTVKDGTSLYVQDQEVITFYINPDENVAVRQVLFNNQDVTDQLLDNAYRTPNVTGSSNFTVLLDVTGDINAREVVLNKTEVAIKVAESVQMQAAVYPNNTTDKTVFWTVENESIATVGPTGILSGVAPGVTKLTVTTQDGGLQAECQVTVMSNDYYLLIDSASTFVDNRIDLPVQMFNTGAANGFQCDVYLPEGLTMEDNGGDFGVRFSERANGHSVSAARIANNAIRIVAYSMDGNDFGNTEGDLFYMPVTTLDSAASFTIWMKNIHISGPNFFDFQAPDIATTIRVAEYPLGDSNGDGEVTVSDVTTTVNELLEQYVPRFVRKAADVNQDDIITVADVSATVDIIVERPNKTVANIRRARAIDPTDDRLEMADFEINAADSKRIEIALNNTRAYTAFQCDIFMPEGLHAKTDENGMPMVALSSRKSASHSLSAAQVSNGALRLVAISMSNEEFSDVEPALFSVTVEADSVAEGSDLMRISEIRLVADEGYEEYLAPDVTATVTYLRAPASVDNLGIESTMHIFTSGHTLVIDAYSDAQVLLVAADGKTMMLNVVAGRNTFEIPQAGVYLVGRQKVIIW